MAGQNHKYVKEPRLEPFLALPGTNYTRISMLVHKKFQWSGSLDCCERPGERKRRRRREQDWASRAKGTRQAALTARLPAETAVTLEWIAERLEREAPGQVNQLLYRRRKADKRSWPIWQYQDPFKWKIMVWRSAPVLFSLPGCSWRLPA